MESTTAVSASTTSQDLLRQKNHLRARGTKIFLEPIDFEYPSSDDIDQEAIDIQMQADGPEIQAAQEPIDCQQRELIDTYRLGFGVLRDVTMALQGSSEKDIAARLDCILQDAEFVSLSEDTDQIDVDLLVDEATKIRQEAALRATQKARIIALDHELKLAKEEMKNISTANKLLRKENEKFKQLLKSRTKASMKLLARTKSLYIRYEELNGFANHLVRLTKETLLAGNDMDDERAQFLGKLNMMTLF